jgi:hypothetical protein
LEPNPVDWLTGSEQPSVRYYALTDLLGRSRSDPEVKEAYDSISKMGWGYNILSEQRADGHWVANERFLYYPKYTATNWRAIMLAELGFTKEHTGIRRVAELYFKEWLSDVEAYCRKGEVCEVGNLARTLTRFGYREDPRVMKLFEWLVDNQKEDGGWHCFKSDSGTLDCWEALAAYSVLPRTSWTKSIKRSAEKGVEFYLERKLFEEGQKYEPWFRFHYPNHYYYDILIGLDVVTALGYAGDRRLEPALKIMHGKRLQNGRWALDAVHPDLDQDASYALKEKPVPIAVEKVGEPSQWITLKCLRVAKSVEEA